MTSGAAVSQVAGGIVQGDALGRQRGIGFRAALVAAAATAALLVVLFGRNDVVSERNHPVVLQQSDRPAGHDRGQSGDQAAEGTDQPLKDIEPAADNADAVRGGLRPIATETAAPNR
jgi:hypothetical protein